MIKKVSLILCFIFSYIFSYSQNFSPRSGPSVTAQDARLSAQLNLYIPRVQDTTLNGGKDTLGALIYKVPDGTYWIRDSNFVSGGHKWSRILKSGDAVQAPVRWTNMLDAGCDTTGILDCSFIVASTIASGQRYLYFPRGHYLLSSQIQLRDSVTIKGDGPSSTVIKLTSNVTAFKCGELAGGMGTQFLDFTIEGTRGVGLTDSTQRGILLDSTARAYISNVRGKSLGGFAFTIINNGYNPAYISQHLRGNILLGVYVEECLGGVLFGDLGEYNSVSSSTFFKNTYGVIVTGGNCRVNNNNIVNNTIGLTVTGGANNAHGVAHGNTINHNATNIFATSASLGFLFADNMMYSGNITVLNSTDIAFTNGVIAGATVTVTNSPNTVFSGVRQSLNTWAITGNQPTVFSEGDTTNAVSLRNEATNKRADWMFVDTTVTFTSPYDFHFNKKILVPTILGGHGTSDSLILGGNDGFGGPFGIVKFGASALSATSDRITFSKSTGTFGTFIDAERLFNNNYDLRINNTSANALASSRILFVNDASIASQIFAGSSTHGFAPNGLFVGTNGVGGIRFVSDGGGDITFGGNAVIGTTEYSRYKANTGRLLIGSSTDLGQKFQVLGSARISDSVFLGNLPTGASTDSVVVINNNLVKKVPASSFTASLNSTQIAYGSGTNTITSESQFNYNATTNRLSADTGTFSRVQVGVSTDFTADSLLVFSDSYGLGVGATSSAFGFSRLLAAQMQLILVNYSLGGTVEDRVPVDPFSGSPQNLVDQTAALAAGTLIDKVARRKYVLIAKGLNDVGYNGVNYTPTNYSTDYQTVLNTFLSKGWAASEIICVTPWYITTAGYQSYASGTGTPQATPARHLEFVDTVIAIATRYGCKLFDMYRSEANNANAGFLNPTDAIHPSNNGHSFIAGQIGAYMSSFFSVLRNNQNIAANGLTDLYRLRLPGLDTMYANYGPRVLVLDTANKVFALPTNGVILNNLSTLSQPSQINVNQKIISNTNGGAALNITDAENILTNGGVKALFLRATGGLPSGLLGNAVELGMVGSVGYVGAFNRTGSSALTLSLNGLGGSVIIGGFSLVGSQTFQVTAGGGYFSGTVGVGISAPARKLDVVIDDGSASTVTYSGRFGHTTTNTAANGVGTGLELAWENASGTKVIGGTIESIATDVVNATEDADMVFRNIRAGALTEAFRISSTGNITTGVWQATAIAPTFGGTGLTSYATGDIIYASATNVLSKLTAGADSTVIRYIGGVPTVGPIVTSSAYVATLTNVTNVAASTFQDAYYQRIGNIVTVYGTILIDATAATTQTELDISLPIPSNLGAATDLSGLIISNTSSDVTFGVITGDNTNDRASCFFVAGALGSNATYRFSFSYKVL